MLDTYIGKRIEDIGRARQILKGAMDTELFEDLSKHNPYWTCPTSEEKEDRLWEIRGRLMCLEDRLNEIWGILNGDDY